jgi:hypothetical protein
MRMEHDLVRQILLAAQAAPANCDTPPVAIEPWTQDVILEHIEALDEAGLVEARCIHNHRPGRRLLDARIVRLTWEGHEFLDQAANSQVWDRVQALVLSRGGSTSLGILKQLLSQAAVRQFRP